MQKSSDDNVVIDSDVMMENCHNNVIKLPKGKLAVLNGLDGFIVAEKDNVLLVCKKEFFCPGSQICERGTDEERRRVCLSKNLWNIDRKELRICFAALFLFETSCI